MSGWYELKKAENGQYSFSLRDANGDVLLRSEQYKARDSATSGIASMQKNSVQDQRFIRLNAADGRSCSRSRGRQHDGRRRGRGPGAAKWFGHVDRCGGPRAAGRVVGQGDQGPRVRAVRGA